MIWRPHCPAFTFGDFVQFLEENAKRPCMYVYEWSLIADWGQTGYGCQYWSADQGKLRFPCPRSHLRIQSRNTGSAFPSRVSRPRLNLVLCLLTGSSHYSGLPRLLIRRTWYMNIVNRHRVSPECIGPRGNSLPMVFTPKSPPAQCPQRSSSNGCCLLR